MTAYTLATLPAFALKVRKIADAVVSQAAVNILVGIKTGPSLAREGRREPGTIPLDNAGLRNSLQSTLYGSSALTGRGEDAAILVAQSMTAGDVARFAWGGPLALYARIQHSGGRGIQGTFWIDVAANRWPAAVAGAVAKAKAEITG